MSDELDALTKMINEIEDHEELIPGLELISSMARIVSLREEANKLEEDLYNDEKRLRFAYHADLLDDEEIIAASASVKGRFRHLVDMAKKKALLESMEKDSCSACDENNDLEGEE